MWLKMPIRIRRLRISRAKYILTFTTAAILLCTYISTTDYDTINQTTELRHRGNVSGGINASSSLAPPPANVFFLKVHKSASSTVQNVLMRYGLKHALNFVLPFESNYLGHPAPFDPAAALPLADGNGASYNIFCHHARYERGGVASVIPRDGAVYVTILRSPAHLFESLYSYFNLESFHRMNLTDFAAMPRWWPLTCARYCGRIGVNQMAFDLGMDDADFADQIKIDRLIGLVEADFDLVMIAEFFDESLVLLKHLLKLDLEDVVYFAHNRRLGSNRIVLTAEDRRKIAGINRVDQLLYEHFIAVFRRKMAEFGEARMRQEVEQLREVIGQWRVTCGAEHVGNGEVVEGSEFKEFSDKVHAIRVRSKAKGQLGGGQSDGEEEFCENLAKAEMPFTNQLRRAHLQKHGGVWLRFLYFIGYYTI